MVDHSWDTFRDDECRCALPHAAAGSGDASFSWASLCRTAPLNTPSTCLLTQIIVRQATASLLGHTRARHAAGKTEDVESPHELLYGFTYTASDRNTFTPADIQRLLVVRLSIFLAARVKPTLSLSS